MTEILHLRECAEACLRLAESATDPRIAAHLQELAADADQAATKIETTAAWFTFRHPPDELC